LFLASAPLSFGAEFFRISPLDALPNLNIIRASHSSDNGYNAFVLAISAYFSLPLAGFELSRKQPFCRTDAAVPLLLAQALVDTVLAGCPDCDAVASFDTRSQPHLAGHGDNQWASSVQRTLLRAHPLAIFRCNACSRGAVAKIHDNGSGQSAVLKDFLPRRNPRRISWLLWVATHITEKL
jgi:hypothetical protein